MSKSDNRDTNRINLSDSPDDIRRKVMKAVTDSNGQVTFDPKERPGVSNLVSIYSALTGATTAEVCQKFNIFTGRQTVDLKHELADVLINELAPIRREINHLQADRGYILQVLREGSERARKLAEPNLTEIKDVMGIKLS